jgi:hypothetical protein
MKFHINHNLVFVLGIFDWFFALIPCFVFPRCHRFLRENKYYFIAIILGAALFYVNSFLVYNSNLYTPDEKRINYILFFNPLLFLALYKISDKIILGKFKRHIYFRILGGSDIETKESTWLEFILQIFLGTSFLFCAIIGKIVIKYCC